MTKNIDNVKYANGCIENIYIDNNLHATNRDCWEHLSRLLINKYIYKVKWIKSVNRVCNYDETTTITFYQDNGVKYVFTIIEN